MKIYINDFNSQVKAEILPSNVPTLDETLETFSFALLSTDNSLGASQIAPMQKIMVAFSGEPNLPTSYQEVDYIYFQGAQYIDTGVAPGTNIKFEISVSDVTDGTYILTQGNYGLRVYNNNFINFVQNKRYRVKNVRIGPSYKYDIKGSNTSLSVNKIPAIAETDSDTPAGNVVLFSSAGLNSQGKLYGCKIWNGATLVRDLIPCYRKSDNAIGLYDLVGGSFYINDGTGTFTKGNDVPRDIAYFYIVSDNVEVFSTNPVRYKHNINCIQNTRELSKHLVRNSIFSQPAQPKKESYNSVMGCYYFGDVSHRYFVRYGNNDANYPLNVYSYPLTISSREKAKKLKVRIEMKVAKYNANGEDDLDEGNVTWIFPKTKSEISFPSGLTPSWFNSLALKYKIGGTSTTDTLTPSMLYKDGVALSEFEFNQDLDCPTITNLINNSHATDLELRFNGLPIICDGYGLPTTFDGCVVCYITTVKIVAETYYYNCYDILNLLIKRQQKSTSVKTHAALFELPPSGELYNLLKSTVAPNFYFTQLTMYECVAEVFRLFDAIFTMDEDGRLGIEYFNDLSGEVITPKLAGKNESISEDKYTNGLDVNYQDARVEESFPCEGNFAHVRVDHVGVPQEGDFYFLTPHPIQSVSKFETLINMSATVYTSTAKALPSMNSIILDLSHFIVDYELWSSLDIDTPADATIYTPKQSNTVYFQKGTNKIALAENKTNRWGYNYYVYYGMLTSAVSWMRGAPYSYVATDVPDWKSILLRCDYMAVIDGKLRIESIDNKYNGETLVDQVNGAVDLNKLGLNVLGLALKLGQPTLNATHIITTWDKRIKTGQIYNYEGGTWIANVCSYTLFGNGYLKGQISFVKNFNQLALRTQLLREKRMSNISQELVTKSEDIIIDYLYISSEFKSLVGENVHYNTSYVYTAIKDSFKNDGVLKKLKHSVIFNDNVDSQSFSAYASSGTISQSGDGWESELTISVPHLLDYPVREIQVLDRNGRPYSNYDVSQGWDDIDFTIYAQDSQDFQDIRIIVTVYKNWQYIYLPLIRYGAGNALCFEMAFDEPMSAGLQTRARSGWFGSNDYLTDTVKYTDAEGFKDTFEIQITSKDSYEGYGRDFPTVPLGDGTKIISIEDYDAYKQPNEIFALNYEIILLAVDYNVDFIGSKLVNENFLVTSETPLNQTLRLYYTTTSDNDDFQYSVLDTEGHEGHYTSITNVSQIGGRIEFDFAAISNLKTWAICDENGKIYFASNRAFSDSKSSVVLYLYPRNSRIE